MKGSCLKYFAISLLCSIGLLVAEPVGKCPSANEISVEFLTDQKDCSIFYQCDWGNPVKFQCAVGLYFNSQINVCDWPHNVNCNLSENNTTEGEITDSNNFTTQNINSTTESYVSTTKVIEDEFITTTSTVNETTTISSKGCLKATCSLYSGSSINVTFYPHDTDCGRYCMCDWYGVVHDMICPGGLQWNSELNTCDWPWNVKCDIFSNNDSTILLENTTKGTSETELPLSTTTETNNTTQANISTTEIDTTNDFDENSETTTENRTDTESTITTEINETTESGTYITTSESAESEITTDVNNGCLNSRCPLYPAPPANVSFFSHDTDCERYCMCDWYGVAHDMACPGGLQWNSVLNTCDWPWKVECEYVTHNSSTNSSTEAESSTEIQFTTDSNDIEKTTVENNTEAETTINLTVQTNITTETNAEETTTKSYIQTELTLDSNTETNSINEITTTTQSIVEGITTTEENNTNFTSNNSSTTDIQFATNVTDTTNIDDQLTTNFVIESTTSEIISPDVGCISAKCPSYPIPPANVTFFPHDTDCTRYCMCDWYGVAHDMSCPNNLRWNSALDTCDWLWNVECESFTDGSSTNSNTDIPARKLNTENSNTLYSTTDSNNVKDITNGNSSETNSTLDSTSRSTKINTETNNYKTTSESEISISENGGCLNTNCPLYPAPPARVTYFPHDTNCERYCMCDWFGIAHDMSCPNGLYWNADFDICDWPWKTGYQ